MNKLDALIDAFVKTAFRPSDDSGIPSDVDRWVYYLPIDGRRCTSWSEEQVRAQVHKALESAE